MDMTTTSLLPRRSSHCGAGVVADLLALLRKNAARRDELLTDRDRLIVEARAAGATTVAIAEAAGLSRMQVHRILTENGSK